MNEPDPRSERFVAHCASADHLMTAMDRRQLYESVRLLGCAAAYAGRYGETLSLPELIARIRDADTDPTADALVSEGMALAVAALRAAGGSPRPDTTGD